MIDCSISIVNFNTREQVCNCIASVIRHTKGISYELIVIDNDSRDGSVEEIRKRFPHVQVIANSENRHFTKASNQGMRASKGRYTFTLNPDCYIEEDIFTPMVAYMDSHADVGASGPTFLNPDGTLQSLGHRFPGILYPFFQILLINTVFPNNPVRRNRDYRENKLMEIDAMGGGGIMVRREVIDQIGYLDENFLGYFEDTDFSKRIRGRGWKIMHLPDVKIYHIGGQSTVKMNRKLFENMMFDSMQYYYRKHYGAWTLVPIKILLYGFHNPVLATARFFKRLFSSGPKPQSLAL